MGSNRTRLKMLSARSVTPCVLRISEVSSCGRTKKSPCTSGLASHQRWMACRNSCCCSAVNTLAANSQMLVSRLRLTCSQPCKGWPAGAFTASSRTVRVIVVRARKSITLAVGLGPLATPTAAKPMETFHCSACRLAVGVSHSAA
jgi:hypothetical protein